jgi:hypothetical protein
MAKPSRKGEKRLTYNADCRTYRKAKIHVKKGNQNKKGKTKLVGPLVFRKTKISYSKVCQQGTGGSDSGHLAAGTAAAQLN